jgi:hypothetical protein
MLPLETPLRALPIADSIRLKHEALLQTYENRQMRDQGPSDLNMAWIGY